MGTSKLDTLEGRPDFIKKFVKSYGKTNDDILAADATETAASAKVAHQGWTIPAGGNDNPNAMRETIIAMNIGSDIGTDDDAGLGIGGGGGGAPTGSIFDISAVPNWTDSGMPGLLANGDAQIVIFYSMYGFEMSVGMDAMFEWYLELWMGTTTNGYNPMLLSDFNAGFAGISEGMNIKFQSGTTVGEADDGWNFDIPMVIAGKDGNPGINPNSNAYNQGNACPMISLQIPATQHPGTGKNYRDAIREFFGFGGFNPTSPQTYYNSSKGFGLTHA